MMKQNEFFSNKTIPSSIEKEARIALSHYPRLGEVPIEFRFKDTIKNSVMQAQPTYSSIFFKHRTERKYLVLISRKFEIEGSTFIVKNVRSEVLIGWFGHELGHIIDYLDKGNLEMMLFGIRYLFSKDFFIEAEREADTIAVNHGMSDYILETKRFILNNTSISEKYKNRIKSFYMSPEEIMQLIEPGDSESLKKAVGEKLSKST